MDTDLDAKIAEKKLQAQAALDAYLKADAEAREYVDLTRESRRQQFAANGVTGVPPNLEACKRMVLEALDNAERFDRIMLELTELQRKK